MLIQRKLTEERVLKFDGNIKKLELFLEQCLENNGVDKDKIVIEPVKTDLVFVTITKEFIIPKDSYVILKKQPQIEIVNHDLLKYVYNIYDILE